MTRRALLLSCALLASFVARPARPQTVEAYRTRSLDELKTLRVQCEIGRLPSCADLAYSRMYDEQSTKPRILSGLELLEKICHAGSLIGCFYQAQALDEGKVIARNAARAAALYKKGCDAGHGWSCGYLGRMLADGDGVPRDIGAAVAKYSLACDGGFEKACVVLAELRRRGLAGEKRR